MKKMKVFITDKSFPSYENFDAEIVKAGGIPVHATAQDEATLIAEGSDADVVVNSFAMVTANFINSLTNCTLIIRTGIGVNTIDVDAATAKKIRVAYVPDYCRDEVADHILSLILSTVRKVRYLDKLVRDGEWTDVGGCSTRAGAVPRLYSSTLGIVGFGAIAQKVARRISGFGTRVVAYDPWVPDEVFESLGAERVTDLDDLYAQADMISVNVPLTDDTFHILNRESFAKMKDGVFVFNAGRGPLIDEQALIEALQSGKVGGAGLDVFEVEPLPADSPFYGMENVVITPHAAYYSKDSLPELQNRSLDEVLRALRNEPARVLYNKAALGL